MEQSSRRECLEIKRIPVLEGEDANELGMNVEELVGVEIEEDHVSVSHRLPSSSKYKGKKAEPAISVKFVRRDVKERFYKRRKHLKELTTHNLGFASKKRIYINESLTESNKELFNECVKAKKDLKFLYIWTSYFLQKWGVIVPRLPCGDCLKWD